MPADAVPNALWPRVSELIAEKIGLHFPPERRLDLERGLSDAAADFGFADGRTCADWLLTAPLTGAQLHTLASHLTIGETYFFRERSTLDALGERILPELIRRRRGHGQHLRLWSAACSTGEEPYSLAILLHQLLPDWQDWRVTILATDVNRRSLQKAAAGVYGEWSFRESPPALRERYFMPTADRRFAVVPEIRKRVRFAPLNLAQDGFPSLATDTNAMDVILCRNVLMYFTPLQADKLVANLRHALLDDGWLAVSPCEYSQTLFSRFVTVNFPGAVLYRKGGSDERAESGWAATTPVTVEQAAVSFDPYQPPTAADSDALTTDRFRTAPETDAVTPAEPSAAAEALYQQGRYADVSDLLLMSFSQAAQTPLPSSRTPFGPHAFSLLTRALANQGKLADALAWSERWIAADKIDAAAHYLRAMVLQELGERGPARRSLQRAVYLQPVFALAHFALGNCARGDARSADANKHFENALRVLRGRPPEELVPESDGLTVRGLSEMITALSSQSERSDAALKR